MRAVASVFWSHNRAIFSRCYIIEIWMFNNQFRLWIRADNVPHSENLGPFWKIEPLPYQLHRYAKSSNSHSRSPTAYARVGST